MCRERPCQVMLHHRSAALGAQSGIRRCCARAVHLGWRCSTAFARSLVHAMCTHPHAATPRAALRHVPAMLVDHLSPCSTCMPTHPYLPHCRIIAAVSIQQADQAVRQGTRAGGGGGGGSPGVQFDDVVSALYDRYLEILTDGVSTVRTGWQYWVGATRGCVPGLPTCTRLSTSAGNG